MLQKMKAEIVCFDQSEAAAVTADLIEASFDVEMLEGDEWVDDESSCVWLVASAVTELGVHGFYDWVHAIIDRPAPNGIIVLEAGPGPLTCELTQAERDGLGYGKTRQ